MIHCGRGHISHCSSLLQSLAALTAAVSVAAASPDPEKEVFDYGPPFNRATLPWEILGLVGGYVVTVAVLLSLLFTVGRRMRRNAQMSPVTLDIEMVKNVPQSIPKAFEPTPISPAASSRSWFGSMRSPKMFKKTPSVRSGEISNPCSPMSPGVQSVTSFDDGRIQADKEDRAKEMERLYAAVMAHEDEKEARKSAAQSMTSDIRPASQHTQSGPKSPLRINTSDANVQRFPEPQSATSPRSPYRAIYPPHSARSGKFDYDMPGDHMPVQQFASMAPPSQQPHRDSQSSTSRMPLSPRNLLTRNSRPPSSGSSSSKTRKALKNLRISAPVQRYPGGPTDDEEARTPLSPRFYNPPAPPAPPSAGLAHTPGTANTTDSTFLNEMELRDEPQPLPMPRPAPQRLNAPPSLNLPSASGSTSSPIRSAASSTSTLPLRSYANTPLNAVPPTPTKTTYLEHRKEKLSLLTPRTGVVPSTPYSPYMPFTPITPVSARLVTKRERKERKKMEGKRVLTEEDLVVDDGDMGGW